LFLKFYFSFSNASILFEKQSLFFKTHLSFSKKTMEFQKKCDYQKKTQLLDKIWRERIFCDFTNLIFYISLNKCLFFSETLQNLWP